MDLRSVRAGQHHRGNDALSGCVPRALLVEVTARPTRPRKSPRWARTSTARRPAAAARSPRSTATANRSHCRPGAPRLIDRCARSPLRWTPRWAKPDGLLRQGSCGRGDPARRRHAAIGAMCWQCRRNTTIRCSVLFAPSRLMPSRNCWLLRLPPMRRLFEHA